ncbi:MAG: hypothetical protein AAF483_04695 [Planctomycetota bacterium]
MSMSDFGTDSGIPVAESYDELQAIRQIDSIYRISREQGGEAEVLCVLVACVDCIFLNISQIVDKNRKTLKAGRQGKQQDIAKRQLWVRELLELALHLTSEMQIQNFALRSSAVERAGFFPNSAFQLMIESVEGYCQQFREEMSGGGFVRSAIDHTTQFDPDSNIIHMLKVNCHSLRCIFASLSNVAIPSGFRDKEYESLLQQLVSCPSAYVDTFLQQFCLLHQIPELLSRIVVDRVRDALQVDRRDKEIAAFGIAERLIRIAQSCLRPLVNELLPLDYADIRQHLGVTSGSHSKVIASVLLQEVVEELREFIVGHLGTTKPSPQKKRVIEMAYRIFDLLHRWRELHVHLPRNVLGVGGVKSLIGSREAVRAAESLASRHQGESNGDADYLQRLSAFAIGAEHIGEEIVMLDQLLLEKTGESTKVRFKAVQERTGIFSKRPRIDDGDDENG